jgi:ribonuclease HII
LIIAEASSTPKGTLPLFPDLLSPDGKDRLFYETVARKAGYGSISGVEEAGRGPLAGPVVAAAVILPEDVALDGIDDSKRMTETARDAAFPFICRHALALGVGVVSRASIDRFNILRASLEAMKLAVLSMDRRPDFLLIDGIHEVPIGIPQWCLKKGDQISASISAASVVAKVYRDRIMHAYHEMYPDYGFHQHKGYGTRAHLEAIRQFGPSPCHRLTFKGVLNLDPGKAGSGQAGGVPGHREGP